MSHITVHRRGKLRTGEIGRVAQIEALPPQPARLDQSLWQINRKAFTHGVYPGRLSMRVGKQDPRLDAAKEAALDAGADPALVEQLDIDDLIITPEFISGSVGGIAFRTRWGPAAGRRAETTDTGLVPTGEFSTLIAYVAWVGVVRSRDYVQGTSADTPCRIIEISASWSFTNSPNVTLGVLGYGELAHFDGVASNNNMLIGGSGSGMGHVVLGGIVAPYIAGEDISPNPSLNGSANITVITERLKRAG